MGKVKQMAMEQRDFELYHDEQEMPGELSHHLALSKAVTSLKAMDAATIDTLAKAEIQSVAEGDKDPVDLFTLSAKGLAYFKAINDNVKPYVYAQNLAQKGSSYTKNGVELSPAELGVKYDYSKTNDPELAELNAKFDEAKKNKEARESFLKGIKDRLEIVNTDTGEVATVYPPIKTGMMGYKATIK